MCSGQRFTRPASLLLGLLLLSMSACGDGGPTEPDPVATSVVVTPGSTTLQALGSTAQFSATVLDQKGQAMPGVPVNWSSSNPSVATVGPSGLATASSVGSTTITAAAGTASGTAVLTVTQVVVSVAVTPSTHTMTAHAGTVQLIAAVKDGNGNAVGGATVNWSSSDPNCVQVSASGLATAGNPGTATITATSGGVSGTAVITVLPPPVATVEVTPAEGSVLVGSKLQLAAVTKDASGNVLTGRTVSWMSHSPSVASVDNEGRVTGLAPGGPVTITATSEGKSGDATVTVLAPVASVQVGGIFRIKVGDTYTYKATLRLADGTVVDRPITWGILEREKGTMTPDGHLTPLKTGTITILVNVDGRVWEVTATAYDWLSLSGSGHLFLSLEADILITNKWGTSEYPQLVFACSAEGRFFAWVDTRYFVTQSGRVAYFFDDGGVITQTWIEFDNFSALGHPGPTNLQVKSFAMTMASARTFGFGFTEFNGPAKVTIFRVTGMSPLLAPLLTACPSNTLVADPHLASEAFWSQFMTSAEIPDAVRSEWQLRRQTGPQESPVPDLRDTPLTLEVRTASRRH